MMPQLSNKKEKSFYEILEVAQNATKKEIKKSRNKLALQYHPDKTKGPIKKAKKNLKAVNEAYAVLSDAEKREKYDEILNADVGNSQSYEPSAHSALSATPSKAASSESTPEDTEESDAAPQKNTTSSSSYFARPKETTPWKSYKVRIVESDESISKEHQEDRRKTLSCFVCDPITAFQYF